MKRDKQVRSLILDAVDGDYEDFDTLVERVIQSAEGEGLITLPDPAEILR
jgi:hypothetical protein